MEAGRGCLSSRNEPLGALGKADKQMHQNPNQEGPELGLPWQPAEGSQSLWGGRRDLPGSAAPASKPSSGSAQLSMDTGEGQGHREAGMGSHYQL